MAMVMAVVGVLLVVILVLVVVNSKDEPAKDDEGTISSPSTNEPKPSNLDTSATAKKASPPPVDEGPQNAYDKARNAKFDMAKLKPLMAKVDMHKWEEIDKYISDAYALKADAEKARDGGDEDRYKDLAKQAIDTWRKGDRLYENFIFEVGAFHPDLWDACFQKEERRYTNSAKAMRGFLPYETKKH